MKPSNDLLNAQFNKAAFGYRQDEVDDYVQDVSTTIKDLVAENKDLEEKLETLAGRLEEYREDEESLRSAILGAQKLGDKIIRDSQSKAEVIMRDATTKADRLVETAQRRVEREQLGLAQLQKEVADFKNRLMTMYKQHLNLISALPGDERPLEPAQQPSQPAAPTHRQEPPPQPVYEEEEPEADMETGPEPPYQEEPAGGHGEGKYGNLMFGDEFDFSRSK